MLCKKYSTWGCAVIGKESPKITWCDAAWHEVVFVTILKLIIFLQLHVLKCFVFLIPQQLAKNQPTNNKNHTCYKETRKHEVLKTFPWRKTYCYKAITQHWRVLPYMLDKHTYNLFAEIFTISIITCFYLLLFSLKAYFNNFPHNTAFSLHTLKRIYLIRKSFCWDKSSGPQ